MMDEEWEVVGLNEGVFGCVAEKIVGGANDELIERRGGSHQHGAGASAAAARAARALPGGGDGAGITGHDHGVQGANLHGRLERACGNHAADFSIADTLFEVPAL